jgi:hypothetical protein
VFNFLAKEPGRHGKRMPDWEKRFSQLGKMDAQETLIMINVNAVNSTHE